MLKFSTYRICGPCRHFYISCSWHIYIEDNNRTTYLFYLIWLAADSSTDCHAKVAFSHHICLVEVLFISNHSIHFIISPFGLWPCTLLAVTWPRPLIWLANYKSLQAVTWLCQLVWTAGWWLGGTCSSDWLITNPCRQSRDCISWSGQPAGDWAVHNHLIG
jgi:hypothetical protein